MVPLSALNFLVLWSALLVLFAGAQDDDDEMMMLCSGIRAIMDGPLFERTRWARSLRRGPGAVGLESFHPDRFRHQVIHAGRGGRSPRGWPGLRDHLRVYGHPRRSHGRARRQPHPRRVWGPYLERKEQLRWNGRVHRPDHSKALPLGGAVLTEADPLAGLDLLASRVKEAGFDSVTDGVVDDRLFEPYIPREYIVTPIINNDNLIDIELTPTSDGEPAAVDWRPMTSKYEVTAEVTTRDSPEVPIVVKAEKRDDGVTYRNVTGDLGTVAMSQPIPPLTVHRVGELRQFNKEQKIDEIASYPRTLMIEALERAGVEVAADSLGQNQRGQLPDPETVASLSKAASLYSPA